MRGAEEVEGNAVREVRRGEGDEEEVGGGGRREG